MTSTMIASLPPGFLAPEITAAVTDPSRATVRAIDRVAQAADASHFLLTPRAVVTAASADEVAAILRGASAAGSPVTFRSGGTSLSGQASSASVLVDTRRHFRRIEVLDGGARVRVEPGATVRQVNARLLRHGYRLGPDPASEAACTVGGVVANNSSGMACGIEENTYRTLESMVLVLPSGTVIDTAAPDADRHLRAAEPDLVDGLLRLKRRVIDNPDSVASIRRQFAMKNTMGYGINAFLDFDSPTELLAHLIIGSEGTLGFVASVTYRTVRLKSEITTALAVFPTLAAATRALPDLVATGAATLELMDSTSIRVGQRSAAAPSQIRGFDAVHEAALLIEYHADSAEELTLLAHQGRAVLDSMSLRSAAQFSSDTQARASAWKLRKGLYATVAGARAPGTTALLEDVVVPVPQLADTCAGLQELFARHGYEDSVIFGHAKDGNIHFMLTDSFGDDAGMARFSCFTDDMVDLILDAGGNLKAEHGTGRVMAPFVRRQYGDELYEVMREIKRLCDPTGILNPGVIITDDPVAHLSDFKPTEQIEQEADRCVECGYCEPVCPSKDLTLTPRQRIVVRRAMARAEATGDHALARELDRDYGYEAVDTCAADGMCVTACPVLINTGSLVKRLRSEKQNPVLAAGWKAAAAAWGPVTRAGSTALTAVDVVPVGLARAATTAGRAVLGDDTVPEYSADLPRGGRNRRRLRGSHGPLGAPEATDAPVALYLPACVNSMFGAAEDGPGATDAFVSLCERAGVGVIVPDAIESLCCSTPWTSKGYTGGRQTMLRRVAEAVRASASTEPLRVVSDAASCTEGYAHLLADAGIAVIVEDAVTFTAREILPRLGPLTPIVETLVLHPTCSSTQMGINGDLDAIARVVASRPITPDNWGCCAFAGDRGMLHPELTASATAAEAAEVRAIDGDAHASCNRTCELGMTRATGKEYRHILELLLEASDTLA
jgi:D-lactate dehydrogenase